MEGNIYILEIDNLKYIGSTFWDIDKRYKWHEYIFKRFITTNKGYLSSLKLFEIGKPTIRILEKITCNSKNELLEKEKEYILKYECVNIRLPITNELEKKQKEKEHNKKYYKENKEQINEYNKKYKEENKEEIKEHNKKYYNILKKIENYYTNCECGGTYTKYNKDIHFNSNKHLNFYKEDYKKYKDRKWTCTICNKEMNYSSKNRHNKTIHLEENKISI